MRRPFISGICFKQCDECKWFTEWLHPAWSIELLKKQTDKYDPNLDRLFKLCSVCTGLDKYINPYQHVTNMYIIGVK